MTNKDLFTALRNIDERYVLEAAPDEKKRTSPHIWMRWVPVAACFCVTVGLLAGLVVPMMRKGAPSITDGSNDPAVTNGGLGPADTSGKSNGPAAIDSYPAATNAGPIDQTTPGKELPRLPMVAGKGGMTGEPGFAVESGEPIEGNPNVAVDVAMPRFDIGAVVEARVIEVLPDSYFLPGERGDYRIARLQILDEIYASGFPEEIYFRFGCYGGMTAACYDRDVFDGCDSLILSLGQIGIENYLLFNRSDGEAEYFPNMFTVVNSNDIGYGRLIAFRDGVLNESFYDREGWHAIRDVLEDPEYFQYPASYKSTIEQVKENILRSVEENPRAVETYRHDYLSANDIFDYEETRQIPTEVQPGEYNVYAQYMETHPSSIFIQYTRLINGFPAEDAITVRIRTGEPAEVTRSEVGYTPGDLDSVPDLSVALNWLKKHLSEIELPHIAVPENPSYSLCRADGFYRMVDGRVCGVIRIVWTYGGNGTEIQDDCYFFIDDDGLVTGICLDREKIRNFIGEDDLIQSFPYEEIPLPMA